MYNHESLGSTIKTLRINNKLSQADLAYILNVSRSSIASYENDSRRPDYENLVKLARYFEVSVDFLLGLKSSNGENSFNNKILNEIDTLLNSMPLDTNKKEMILKELVDYFMWKVDRLSKEDPFHPK